jgi:hypothetical protein
MSALGILTASFAVAPNFCFPPNVDLSANTESHAVAPVEFESHRSLCWFTGQYALRLSFPNSHQIGFSVKST